MRLGVGAALLAAFSFAAGCGYVGDPEPPALHIPMPVTALEAVQVGSEIRVRFSLPERSTDNLPLGRLGTVDLQFDDQPIAVDTHDPGPVEVRVPAAAWVGKQIRVQVRAASENGKWSEPATAVSLLVVEPVEPPSSIAAVADPRGVRLSWEMAEGMKARINRRNRTSGEFEEAAEVSGREWVDASAPFGVEQQYVIRAVAQGENVAAESEPSPPVAIRPEDKFPPSVPGNLTAVPGLKTIELAWEQSPEPDTAGYVVYRAGPEGEFEKAGPQAVAGSFSDAAVEKGKTYRYAVSAVDVSGNESARSEPLTVTAP